MAQKDRSVRRVDERKDDLRIGGGQLLSPAVTNIVAPNIPSLPEPEDVTIGSETLLRTTLVPKVLLQVTWNNPTNLIPDLYEIQAAKDSAFTTGVLRFNSTLPSAVLELNTDTDYWIRVRAVVRGLYGDWGYPSNYPTVSVHTIGDTTPPDEVSSVVTNWDSGDLLFSFTFPSSDNVFDARIRIFDSPGGTLYKEVFIPGSPNSTKQYIFRAIDNRQVTSENPLLSVYYTIHARSIAHVLSVAGVTGTVTKTPIAKPINVVDTWSGDNGTFDESVTIKWDRVNFAGDYIVIIDGVTQVVAVPQITYNYTKNVADHRPTLVSGDWNLAYTVQARDTLRQVSPGASGTAQNTAPQDTNIALTTAPGFSSLYAYVNHTNDILDLHHYTWTLYSGGIAISRVVSQTPEITFPSLNGTYTLQVTATDMFGRTSNPVTASGLVLDGLTIEKLRADLVYTSSEPGDLQAELNLLKDGNLTGEAVGYVAGSGWKWIKAERALIHRHRTITVSANGSTGNPSIYFGVSVDDNTYSWYAGPLVATGTTGQNTTLTEYSDEATAKANAVTLSNAVTSQRYDLPAMVEARYIKMGHRNTTIDYYFSEYYPRRLIQSDDGEFEFIKSINIAASAVLADHISVIDLSAVNTNTGTLDVSGTLTVGLGGEIIAGDGHVTIDDTGFFITFDNDATNTDASIRFKNPSGGTVGQLQGYYANSGAQSSISLGANAAAVNKGSEVSISAARNGTGRASIYLTLENNSGPPLMWIQLHENHPTNGDYIDINAPLVWIDGDTIIQNSTLTVEDTITSEITDSATNALTNNLILQHLSTGTPAANFGTAITFQNHSSNNTLRNVAQIYGEWTVATDASRQGRLRIIAVDTVGREGLRVTANGSAVALGFFGSAGNVRQAITGVSSGTPTAAQMAAVIRSIIAAGVAYGFWTDSTT